ncbi:8-amino-7-oxononanoate synthase [Pseudomonas sp. HK3]|jgi:8-amino-7-oxononanoate synthase
MPFDLSQDLNLRREQNLYRATRLAQSPQGPLMQIDGAEYLTFCSNDYLGLANHPALVAAFKQAANEFGVGSGAAHLVNGHSYYHQQLEEALAEFTGRESALLFSTGYMANLGVITALLDKQDGVFEDKWNHASLLDAGLLSGARFQRYLHNDVANLTARLARSEARRKLIVTDGVFSMDGDDANLQALSTTAKQHDAWIMVDDAHGLGVLGKTGAGICEAQQQDQNNVQILMGTLGKGMGTAGAFVAGSKELTEYLTNFSRPYIYTTAMPAAIAAATLASINIVKNEPQRREHLHNLIQQFKLGAQQLGLNVMPSDTAIQPILIGDAQRALYLSEQLRQQGIMVTAIRPPTVPPGTARLRITLSASHSIEHVETLLDALSALSSTMEAN